MSNDPRQPNQPSPYDDSPYGQPHTYYPPPASSGQGGQAAYPPPPPGQSGQTAYPEPSSSDPTQLAYPPSYVNPPAGQSAPSAYQPPVYGTPAYPQPVKKSRRLLWIILGVVGVLVILIVAGIVGLVVLVNNNPATAAVNSYYTAIKNQSYTQAYTYLDPTLKLRDAAQTPLTQGIFVQGLQQVDQQKGKVSNYAITSTSLDTNNGISKGSYTVSVTRNGTTYNVHLVLQQENGQWKITSFDTV